jgi:phage gp45-like
MNGIKEIAARLRNLFCLADFQRRYEDGKIQVETHNGKVLEKTEAFPYGFYAKAKGGKALVLCQGGNFDSFELLPVLQSAQVLLPELAEGDVALYTEAGGWVICRNTGTLELNGTDNGGIVKVRELQNQLQKNNQILSTLLAVFCGAPISEAGNGSPSSLQATLATALASLQVGDFSNIASAKVVHGNGKN